MLHTNKGPAIRRQLEAWATVLEHLAETRHEHTLVALLGGLASTLDNYLGGDAARDGLPHIQAQARSLAEACNLGDDYHLSARDEDEERDWPAVTCAKRVAALLRQRAPFWEAVHNARYAEEALRLARTGPAGPGDELRAK
jgi:hypothetical protein